MSFTAAEALSASVNYFNGDELAGKVFIDKYALRDEKGELLEKTPTDMHHRLAKEFARIEAKKFKEPLTEEQIFSLFDKFKYIVPQGSPMSAIGNSYQLQTLGNCFCLPPVLDSYAGILYTDQQLVQLCKRRAGIGICIDAIRPKGMPTNNAAKTTDGIGVFMERFSNSCREVAMHGRRGALLLSLSVHHPEIETFINIKRDLTKVTGANISVKFSDVFMKAVKEDTEYEQKWPINSDKPVVINKIKARKVWDQFIEATWASAEPGALFWDTVQREGLSNCYKQIDSNFEDTTTNPCLPKWAKLLTPTGIKELKDVNIGDDIWSETGWTKIINKWSTGVQKVYKYKTTFSDFYSTEDHQILTNNTKTPIKQALSIDILQRDITQPPVINLQTVIDGLVIGDGAHHKASNNKVYLDIGTKDTDYLTDPISSFIENKCGIGPYAYNIKTTITYQEVPRTWERKVPQRFLCGSCETVCSFLRGLYSANGSVTGERITLKAASLQIIKDVQLMLSSIGIPSYYTTNKSTKVKFANGEYICKQSYDLNITRPNYQRRFQCYIGFIQSYKAEKLTKLFQDRVESVKPEIKTKKIIGTELISEEEVFDITVDNATHTFWCNGFNIANCGEIPQGFDSCRLIAENAYSFVDNPFTKKAKFNFEKFDEVTQVAQRLMDDLIDLELEAMDKIIAKVLNDPEPLYIKQIELDTWKQLKANCINGRRTGLGITGLGDALAALNIKYGSPESIQKTEKIYKQLAISSMKASCLLAKELGAFPIYNKEIEATQPFLLKLFTEATEVKELHDKYGRRNISLTTTAPAGSISCLTQTSSGIEPVFALSYTRRRKLTQEKQGTTVDTQGDIWEEFKIHHEKLKIWMNVTGDTNIKNSPYWEATANEIDWEKSVDIQAAAQKWLTHSVSKTCNLPKNATKELVAKVYLRAHETLCKGFTVYRDGCRDGVLINDEPLKVILPKTQAPKRPKTLPCELHCINSKKAKILVVVGLAEGEPYELFASTIDKCEYSGEAGNITKLKRGHYVIKTKDGEVVVKDTHKSLTAEEAAITRLTSTALRHGADVAYIVQQLEKVEGDWGSFTHAIARVLKGYIKNGVKVTGDSCPSCKSPKLIRLEGCVSCESCSWTKC